MVCIFENREMQFELAGQRPRRVNRVRTGGYHARAERFNFWQTLLQLDQLPLTSPSTRHLVKEEHKFRATIRGQLECVWIGRRERVLLESV